MTITNATPNIATDMATGQMAVFNATQTFASAVSAVDEDILFTVYSVFSAGGSFNRCGVAFNLANDTSNVRNKACAYTSCKIRFVATAAWNKIALSNLTNCVVTGTRYAYSFPYLSGASAWNNVVLAGVGQIVFDTDAVVSAFTGVQLIDNNGGFWKSAASALTCYGLVFSGTLPASMFVQAAAGDCYLINSYSVLPARTRVNAGAGRFIYQASRNMTTTPNAKFAAWDKGDAAAYTAQADSAGLLAEQRITTRLSTGTGGVGAVPYDDRLLGTGYSEVLYAYGYDLTRNDAADEASMKLGTPAAENKGSAISIPKPLTANARVLAAESSAAALACSLSGKVITPSASMTLNDIHDWLHWKTRQDVATWTRVAGVLTVADYATASGDRLDLGDLSLAIPDGVTSALVRHWPLW